MLSFSLNPSPICDRTIILAQFTNFHSICTIVDYIKRYATEDALRDKEEGSSSSASDMSDLSDEEDEAQDMEL